MSETSDEETIPQKLLDAANEAISKSLPDTSKERYQAAYDLFIQWMDENKTNSFNETVLLAYFNELHKKVSPPTLWVKYSMLRTVINVEENVDISNYIKLKAFIKRKNVGYKKKKARCFTSNDIKQFFNEAPDKDFLCIKVALIFGLTGACRRQELHDLSTGDIKDQVTHLIITIPNTKTHIDRVFTVTEPFRSIVINYMKLRPSDVTSFFVKYKNGKCMKQVIGKNTLGDCPRKIAEFLGLPEPTRYTSHSFRHTSTTLLADAGASITELKRHGGWRSAQVAEGYVADSINNKIKICNKIVGDLGEECRPPASKLFKLNNSSQGCSGNQPIPNNTDDSTSIKAVVQHPATITTRDIPLDETSCDSSSAAAMQNIKICINTANLESNSSNGKTINVNISF